MGSENEHSQIGQVIAEILKAEEDGQKLSADDWCAKYASHENSIREFFANREQLGLSNVFQVADMPTLGSADEPKDEFVKGEKIRYFGDYEVIEELARGGMGVVYKARQNSLQRTVALKMILSGELASDDDIARFQTEAEAAAKLDHPGIVPIFEIGEQNGQHYFSMAYIAGKSLADRITNGPLPPQDAARIVAHSADALQYAHDREVIHRDLKPANILMDGDRPKLTDFGLAKRLDQQSVTRTGEVLGTPGYMAPEQASNAEAAGKPSDVYGLGAILYATLTGRPPFQSANVLETLCQVLDADPVPPRQLNASVPVDLETICLAALRKEPDRRYGSAAEFKADLERFLEGRPIEARPVSTFEHVVKWAKRRPMIASLSSALVVTLLAGSAIIGSLWIKERDARTKAIDAAELAIANEVKAKDAAADALNQKNIADGQRAIAQRALVSNTLSMADQLYSNGQSSEAEQRYLKEFRAAKERDDGDRRAWWRLWRTYSDCPRVRRLPVTGSRIQTSPDGRFVAVVANSEISLLDGQTLATQRVLKSPVGIMSQVEFSPDGRHLVASHPLEPSVLLWDLNRTDAKPIQLLLDPTEVNIPDAVNSHFDEKTVDSLRKLQNSNIGLLPTADSTLIVSGPNGLWEFDLKQAENKPVKLASRLKERIGNPDTIPLAVDDRHRVWVSDFTPFPNSSIAIVDVSKDEVELDQPGTSLVGVDGSTLLEIAVPNNAQSKIGMLPRSSADLRSQILRTDTYQVHSESLRMAMVQDGVLSIWDLKTNQRIAEHRWPRGLQGRGRSRQSGSRNTWDDVVELTFSSDGKTLAAIGEQIRILDARTLKIRRRFGWFGDPTDVSADFTGDGQQLLVIDQSSEGALGHVDLYSVNEIDGNQSVVTRTDGIGTRIAADGSLFEIRLKNKQMPAAVFRTLEGEQTRFELPKSTSIGFNLSFEAASDGSRCLVRTWQNSLNKNVVLALDTTTGKIAGPHTLEDFEFTPIIAPDGNSMARFARSSIVVESLPAFETIARIPIKTPNGYEIKRYTSSFTQGKIVFSNDSKQTAIVGRRTQIEKNTTNGQVTKHEEVILVDLKSQRIVNHVSYPDATMAEFVDADRQLAVVRFDRTSVVDFCSLPNFETSDTWQLGKAKVQAFAENVDRGILAVATADNRIWLWDMNRSEALVDFLAPVRKLLDLNWIDGDQLQVVFPGGMSTIDFRKVGSRVDSFVESGTVSTLNSGDSGYRDHP